MLTHESIRIIPLNVIFDGESYRDGIDITAEVFYEKMKHFMGDTKTSQPSVGEFVEVFEELKLNYDRCIAILVSSELSGTYSSCKMASDLVEDFPVEIIDTEKASFPMVFFLREGIRLQSEGKSYDEIVNHLKNLPKKIKTFFLIGDLARLHKGGRLNAAQFLIGNLLQVKPILQFVDKKVQPFEKVRGFKKGKDRILDLFSEDASKGVPMNVCIVHSSYLDEATSWKEEIESKYPHIGVEITELGPVVGVHTGTGTIALTWHLV